MAENWTIIGYLIGHRAPLPRSHKLFDMTSSAMPLAISESAWKLFVFFRGCTQLNCWQFFFCVELLMFVRYLAPLNAISISRTSNASRVGCVSINGERRVNTRVRVACERVLFGWPSVHVRPAVGCVNRLSIQRLHGDAWCRQGHSDSFNCFFF